MNNTVRKAHLEPKFWVFAFVDDYERSTTLSGNMKNSSEKQKDDCEVN